MVNQVNANDQLVEFEIIKDSNVIKRQGVIKDKILDLEEVSERYNTHGYNYETNETYIAVTKYVVVSDKETFILLPRDVKFITDKISVRVTEKQGRLIHFLLLSQVSPYMNDTVIQDAIEIFDVFCPRSEEDL